MRNDNGRLLERPSAKTKKTMGDRAFQVAAPFLNNELIIFQTLVKTFLSKESLNPQIVNVMIYSGGLFEHIEHP